MRIVNLKHRDNSLGKLTFQNAFDDHPDSFAGRYSEWEFHAGNDHFVKFQTTRNIYEAAKQLRAFSENADDAERYEPFILSLAYENMLANGGAGFVMFGSTDDNDTVAEVKNVISTLKANFASQHSGAESQEIEQFVKSAFNRGE